MKTLMKRANGNVPAKSFSGLVDTLFENNLSRFFDDNFWGAQQQQFSSVPVNIRQTENSYELEVVAPGLQKENFKVNVANGLLSISYEERQTDHEEKQGLVKEEYRRMSFSRSFNIDDALDINKIQAFYSDGILKLSIPIREESKRLSRTIEIQ